jgi:hypothetical protein
MAGATLKGLRTFRLARAPPCRSFPASIICALSFSKSSDVHVRFRHLGQAYIVWEPFGDSSRYWIGPEQGPESSPEITKLEDVFKRYRPPLYQTIIGDLLTLRFITRFIGRDS